MKTDDAYYALLERCLRLEACLLGIPLGIPLDPPVGRVYAPIVLPRRLARKATPAEIATMRELRARGLLTGAIADRTGFSDTTVRRLTKEVER